MTLTSFKKTNPVAVGLATKKSHYDDVFTNTTELLANTPAPFERLRLRTHFDKDVALAKVYLDHADAIVMDDGERVTSWDDLIANIAAGGAGGLDTGAEAASTWYQVYAIRKSITGGGDGTKNLLLHKAKDYFLDESQTSGSVAVGLRDASARTKLAQGFQVDTAGLVEFVDVHMDKASSPSGRVWLTIEADAAGVPSGTPLATSDKMDITGAPTTASGVRFVFRNPVSIAALTQYHLVWQGDYSISATNFVNVRASNANPYARGELKQFDGATWSSVGTHDARIKIYITRNDTAVTMPSGYDQKALIGYVYNDGSSNFTPFLQQDRTVTVLTNVPVQSAAAIPVATLTDLSAAVPPVALELVCHLTNSAAAELWAGQVPDGWINYATLSAGTSRFSGASHASITAANLLAEFGAVLTEYQGVYLYNSTGNATIGISLWRW